MAIISNSAGVSQPISNTLTQTATSVASDEGFGFFDLLDMVNPLQHVPIVSHLYRAVTGDTIGPLAQLVGGGIFGGVPGAVGSAVQLAAAEILDTDFSTETASALTGTPRTDATLASDTSKGTPLNTRFDNGIVTENDYPMTADAKRIQARMAYWS